MNRNIQNGYYGWYEKSAMKKIDTLSPRKRASCKLIYIALCSLSAKEKDAKEFSCWKQEIALYASVSNKTVQRHLPELENLKIISISPQDRKSNGKFEKVTIRLKLNNLPVGHFGDSSGTVRGQFADTESDSMYKEIKNKEIKRENKKTFKQFILLTEKEHEKLVVDLGEARADEMIGRLNDYVGSSGKKYKSHYHTILNWVRRDGPKKKETASTEVDYKPW